MNNKANIRHYIYIYTHIYRSVADFGEIWTRIAHIYIDLYTYIYIHIYTYIYMVAMQV